MRDLFLGVNTHEEQTGRRTNENRLRNTVIEVTYLKTDTTILGMGFVVSVQEASTKGGAVEAFLGANVCDIQGSNNVDTDALLLMGLEPILSKIELSSVRKCDDRQRSPNKN